MAGSKLAARIVEGIVAGGCVTFAIMLLSWFEKVEMPMLASIISFQKLDDVKFWAPPLAATAVTVFNAPSVPVLLDTIVVVAASACGAVSLVSLLGASEVARALAAGFSMLFMKVTGLPVAPSAAAFAVLFVDNAKLRELGIFYAFLGPSCWCCWV
eukprot:TRINITY_DN4004_c0_g2_i2.p1 TRINITY_DN4004_c0_g2~~TRINITY_DN4004_c0_g2_i2.p1  ORF type:complete len:175 (-),score=36.74 TRINITY_DN4004_c0_g2_i2:99-566(-)